MLILDAEGVVLCVGRFLRLLVDGELEAVRATCIVYGETARTIQGDCTVPLSSKWRPSEEQITLYARKLTDPAKGA